MNCWQGWLEPGSIVDYVPDLAAAPANAQELEYILLEKLGPVTNVPVIVAETADPADMVGVETILVAEDNADVRSYACGVLSAQGYTVLEAEHGEAALGLAAGHEGTIQLLVADVVMPGVSGCVVAERMMESRPGLKVLYISGYTDDVLDAHGVLGTGVMFLPKPFHALQLLRTVGQVLRKPSQVST